MALGGVTLRRTSEASGRLIMMKRQIGMGVKNCPSLCLTP